MVVTVVVVVRVLEGEEVEMVVGEDVGQTKGSPGTTEPFSAQIYIIHISPSCTCPTIAPTS